MLIKFSIQLLFVSISTNSILPSSATDWIDIGSDKLYSLETTAGDWESVQWECRNKGSNGRLVVIDSSSTLFGLRSYVQKVGGEFWIDISKDMHGGFSAASVEKDSIFNWAEGEPDYVGEDACVYLVAATMEMKDDSCATKRNYICLFDKLNETTTSSTTVTTPAFSTGGMTSLSHTDVATTPSTTVTTPAISTGTTPAISTGTTSLSRTEDFTTLSTSVTPPPTSVSTTTSTASTSFTSAASGIIKEELTTLSTSVTPTPSSVTTTTTTTTSSAPPEPRIIKVLGSNWIDIGSDVVYSIENRYSSWDQAVIRCTNKGINGRLASFDSGAYKSSLRRYIQDPRSKFWIGLRKDKLTGEFKRSGSPQSSYFDWAEGEPNNHNAGLEECVELDASSMQWNDLPCSFMRLYICASDKEGLPALPTSVTPPPTSTTTTTTTTMSSAAADSRIIKVLGSDWIDIGSDVVYSMENSYATWYQAFGKCTMKGINGRLASFESGAYKSSLRRYIKDTRDKFWIGIHKDQSGQFKRFGSPQSSFFDWAKNEPNNHNAGLEECVELDASSMQWNDLPCDFKRFYICASDKAYSTGSENPAVALDISMISEAANSLSLTDIAEECHSAVIAVSFLIVFLFSIILVAVVLNRRYLPRKTIAFKHFH